MTVDDAFPYANNFSDGLIRCSCINVLQSMPGVSPLLLGSATCLPRHRQTKPILQCFSIKRRITLYLIPVEVGMTPSWVLVSVVSIEQSYQLFEPTSYLLICHFYNFIPERAPFVTTPYRGECSNPVLGIHLYTSYLAGVAPSVRRKLVRGLNLCSCKDGRDDPSEPEIQSWWPKKY